MTKATVMCWMLIVGGGDLYAASGPPMPASQIRTSSDDASMPGRENLKFPMVGKIGTMGEGNDPDNMATGSVGDRERVVPHRVVVGSVAANTTDRGVNLERGPIAFSQKGVSQNGLGGNVSVFQRYLRIIRRRLYLTQKQREKVEQLVRMRQEKWIETQQKLRKMQRRYSRVPEAKLFMNANSFNKKDFKMAIISREAQIKYLKEEGKRRHLNWMAETMQEIFQRLTPRQRKKLMNLTSHRKKRLERYRRNVKD